jgi:hypothetical protein
MGKLFLGILIILIIVYGVYVFFTIKWPENPFAGFTWQGLFPKPATSTPPTIGTNPPTGGPPTTRPTTSTALTAPSSTTPTSSLPNVQPWEIPAGLTIKDLSPYFHKIRFATVSPGSPTYPSQLSLVAIDPQSAERINIANWFIQTNRGGQYIPQAVNVYNPIGNAPAADIYLGNGDTVNLYSTASPLGVNIRVNRCIGYLANTVAFNPPLTLNCPLPSRADVAAFTGTCQDYILSLGSCRQPADNPPVSIYDYACRDFLTHLNYAGCYTAHIGDKDFLGTEWRIWLGTQFMDFRHDRLLLKDRAGLVVDEYDY